MQMPAPSAELAVSRVLNHHLSSSFSISPPGTKSVPKSLAPVISDAAFGDHDDHPSSPSSGLVPASATIASCPGFVCSPGGDGRIKVLEDLDEVSARQRRVSQVEKSNLVIGPYNKETPVSMSATTSPGSTASSDSPKSATLLTFKITYMQDCNGSERTQDVVPKIEELDEETPLDPKIESPPNNVISPEFETTQTPNGTVQRRPRGRPRKHPLSPPKSQSAAPKGRSKTGCLTCRKRKKKCDEAKPTCVNCEKNNAVCEGYPPREYWQSRRQGAQKDRRISLPRPPRELPPMYPGVESPIDYLFLDHFTTHLANRLSLSSERNNPFLEILLPMTSEHIGLAHSVLCFSGAHLAAKDPRQEYSDRQAYHYGKAVNVLSSSINKSKQAEGVDTPALDDHTVAQMIVLCLTSICAGDTAGESLTHLRVLKQARQVVDPESPTNSKFREFLLEFYIYHDTSYSITSLGHNSILLDDQFSLPEFVSPDSCMFLGVGDGLFRSFCQTRKLRDLVRLRREHAITPVVDFQMLRDAQSIDQSIRGWDSGQQEGSPRWILARLYRQVAWIYFKRTITTTLPHPSIKEAVDEGLFYVKNLPTDSSSMSILLMPLYLLGVSAFDHSQRPDVLKAFDDCYAFSSLGNIKQARRVVERVWELMDQGHEDAWDFEKVQASMGLNFLIT